MKKQICKLFISITGTILSLVGINYLFKNIFIAALLIIPIFFIFYKNCFPKTSKRKRIYAGILSFLFSFFQVVGYNCLHFDYSYLNHLSTFLYIFSLMPLIYILSLLFFDIKIKKSISKKPVKILDNKYAFIIIFFLIIISWLPILISFYPGNFSYDAGTQLRMVVNHNITKYHPVIHTLLLSETILFGKNIFASYKIGIFFYSILQICIMASIFSYTIIFLHKKKLPTTLLVVLLGIYMFLPTHSIFSFTTTKDIIFSGIFVLFLLRLINLAENPKTFFKSKKEIIYLTTLLFLLLIFRNNMFYAVLITLPYTLIIYKKHFKKLLLIFFCSILLYISYNFTLTKAFSIPNGPRIEAFSVVLQQVARSYHKEKLPKSNKRQIENLFNNQAIKNYNSHISDPIKSEFKSDVLLANKMEYLNLYFYLLKKYPLTCLDSILNTIYPFFYLQDKLPDPNTRTYIEITCLDEKNIMRKSKCKKNIPAIYNLYNNLVNNATYQKNILLNILMNMAIYVWILIAVSIYLLANKKYRYFTVLLPLISLLLTNLLGPVAIVRYAYPMFCALPIFFYLLTEEKYLSSTQ